MKELKFRAWGIKEKAYLKLCSIHLSTKRVIVSIFGRAGGNISLPFSRVILEQYTGLKDKNGKEIYEGDIVKLRGRAYKVKFDNYGQFCLENKKCHWLSSNYSFRSIDVWCAEGILVEIIGNIHENPELLEEKDAKG